MREGGREGGREEGRKRGRERGSHHMQPSGIQCLATNRFVAKVRSLDPSYKDVVPWQPRAYSRKRSRAVKDRGSKGGPEAKKLHSPLVQEGKARDSTPQVEEENVGTLYNTRQIHFHDITWHR